MYLKFWTEVKMFYLLLPTSLSALKIEYKYKDNIKQIVYVTW